MEDIMNTLMKNEPAAVETQKPAPVTYLTPRVDLVETKDAYRLEAEMPGVNKEGLEVLLDNNDLTILGRRGASAIEANYLYRESKPADYRRVFELDPAIDSAKIDAKIEQGVLTLVLPKSEHVKPRKVVVTD
jgi:HSP20 family protein